MYVREDIAADAFETDSEPEWSIPKWFCKSSGVCWLDRTMSDRRIGLYTRLSEHFQKDAITREESRPPFVVFIARENHFFGAEGRGVIDPRQSLQSSSTIRLNLEKPQTLREIVAQLIGVDKDILEPRQCMLWTLTQDHMVVSWLDMRIFPLFYDSATTIYNDCLLWLNVTKPLHDWTEESRPLYGLWRPPASRTLPGVDDVYVLLKLFDVGRQILVGLSSFWVKKHKKLGPTLADIVSQLDVTPKELLGSAAGIISTDGKAQLAFYEELQYGARKLDCTKTFEELELASGCLIIAVHELSVEHKEELLVRGDFTSPDHYVRYLCAAENYPNSVNGWQTRSRFSSKFYEGEMLKNYFHGQGKRIYFNGNVYTGPFCLGRRHSPLPSSSVDPQNQGTMIYANGDTYTGTWSWGLRHGHGKFVEAATGNVYVGGCRRGKKFGEGVTHWKKVEQEQNLCRICYEEEIDTAFVDCGHVMACGKCAGRSVGEGCPVCRKEVEDTLKLWWT